MSDGRLVCEPARLDWSQASGPRAADYDDVYFSAENGLEETRAVFLQGCDLPAAWQGRRRFTVGELGFGTGLNALAVWQLWRGHRPAEGWLDFISVEKHPLSRAEAERAFAAWPELAAFTGPLLAQWPDRHKGAHRLVFPADHFAITVIHDEAEAALGQIDARIDAWFLDGFAPARNEAMWSQPVFDRMGALSAPGARVGTFTVAGAVRRGLQAAGFAVEKRPGFGRKRERLEAVFAGGRTSQRPALDGPVAILGAGISGASLARAFTARGVEAVLVDPGGLAAGASGAPAGLLTPRLERADRPHVRATLAAFDFARNLYGPLDGFAPEGVVRQPKDAAEAARFEAIADLMDADVRWQGGALHLDRAGRFDPARLVAALAGETPVLARRWAATEGTGEGVRLLDAEGKTLLEAALVIHATGAAAASACPDISPSAGQVAVFEGDPPVPPVTWGGYACAAPGGVLVGATHVRGEDAGPPEPAIEAFRADAAVRLPGLSLGAVRQTWSGVRASTPDRLPVMGAVGEREFILSGMGARGFAHAPLLAEALVSEITGGPGVLEADGRAVLDAGRFAARRRRRGQSETG